LNQFLNISTKLLLSHHFDSILAELIQNHPKMELNMTSATDDPNATSGEANGGSSQQRDGPPPKLTIKRELTEESSRESANVSTHGSESVTFSGHNMNPPSISDPTTELTEEDIFRMKSMSIDRNGWKNGLQIERYKFVIGHHLGMVKK
jgi:hypothetical protein